MKNNRLPRDERRVRLAGGPFVKPSTRKAVLARAKRDNKSIGQVIDEALEDQRAAEEILEQARRAEAQAEIDQALAEQERLRRGVRRDATIRRESERTDKPET